MDKDVGVILLEMLVSKGVGKVVVFVGSITWDLTSNVVHSVPKRKSLSSICIQFLATGPLSLSLSSFLHGIDNICKYYVSIFYDQPNHEN
jgi:hypothetical protein